MRTSRALLESFINLPSLALVGVSRTGQKFGNVVLRELRAKGYRVYPINPLADLIDGVRCYHTFADLPEPVGGVVVVVPPESAITVVREAAAAGIRRVWLQQGAASPYVLQVCRELRLETIADECILMFAAPTGIHKVHRAVHDVFHRLSA